MRAWRSRGAKADATDPIGQIRNDRSRIGNQLNRRMTILSQQIPEVHPRFANHIRVIPLERDHLMVRHRRRPRKHVKLRPRWCPRNRKKRKVVCPQLRHRRRRHRSQKTHTRHQPPARIRKNPCRSRLGIRPIHLVSPDRLRIAASRHRRGPHPNPRNRRKLNEGR